MQQVSIFFLVIMTSRHYKGAWTKATNLLQVELTQCHPLLQAPTSPADETHSLKAMALYNMKLEEAHTRYTDKFTASNDNEQKGFDKEEQEVIDLMGDTMQWQLKLEPRLENAASSQSTARKYAALGVKIGELVDQLAAQNDKSAQPAVKPSQMALPKLELPTFDGSATTYRGFWDFSATSENNTTLSKVVKHQYLRSKLVGKAMKFLEGILIDHHNYNVSVKLLQERYGNKQVEIDSHYVAVMELQQASKSVHRLRALLNTLLKH